MSCMSRLKKTACRYAVFARTVIRGPTIDEEAEIYCTLHVQICSNETISLYFCNTGGPRYMRSFYLRFCVYAIQK